MTRISYGLSGRSASASDTIGSYGLVDVYAKKEEIFRLSALVQLAGYKVHDVIQDGQRPSMYGMIIDFNEREVFVPVDLSMVLDSHKPHVENEQYVGYDYADDLIDDHIWV